MKLSTLLLHSLLSFVANTCAVGGQEQSSYAALGPRSLKPKKAKAAKEPKKGKKDPRCNEVEGETRRRKMKKGKKEAAIKCESAPSLLIGFEKEDGSLFAFSESTFNPAEVQILLSLEGGSFANDPSLVEVTLNDENLTPATASVSPQRILLMAAVSSGQNSISISVQTTSGLTLEKTVVFWAGNSQLTVSIEKDLSPFLQEATVVAILQDDQDVSETQTTQAGTVTFSNVPSRTVNVQVFGEGNEIGSSAVTIFSDTNVVTVIIAGIGTPSSVKNLDFSLDDAGWEGNAGATIEDHIENIGPPILPTGDLNIRSRRKLGFFDESLDDKDFCLSTMAIDSAAQSASHVFETEEDTTIVHIRYRFQTSEVPGGYFGTIFNDYFSVSLRSLKRKAYTVETNNMNALGLAAFDSNGATTWRDAWLAVDTSGDTIAVDISVANVADCAYDSKVCIDFVEEWSCKTGEYLKPLDKFLGMKSGEIVLAVLNVGPFDAYEAGKSLANEASLKTAETNLPGTTDGPADAFRHCYWNCRMVKEIGVTQAQEVGDLHENCATNARAEAIAMDLSNNLAGRNIALAKEDCFSSCFNAAKDGDLTTLL